MKGQRFYTKEQENQIIDLYVNQKRGQAYVCKAVGTTPRVMKNFLKKHGYQIRNFSEAASTSNINRALHKNKKYFDIQSSNMAWIMGFIASDGCVSLKDNEIKIGLSAVDEEILIKIRQEIEIENEVKYYTSNKGFDYVSLSWSCKEHKEKLAEYGIIPQKTYKLKPPDKLEKCYIIDYIRGYFDGDGSINFLAGNHALRWQIGSATKEILQFIIDFLYEEYGIPKVNIQIQHRGDVDFYEFQYSTNSTKKIYNILYTPNSLYLKRKKDHFDQIIKNF